MLIPMVVILGLLVLTCILSKIYASRAIMDLEEELFLLIEEQRKEFNQLRSVTALLNSLETRRDLARQECARLQNELFKLQTQIRTLSEGGQRRKDREGGSQ